MRCGCRSGRGEDWRGVPHPRAARSHPRRTARPGRREAANGLSLPCCWRRPTGWCPPIVWPRTSGGANRRLGRPTRCMYSCRGCARRCGRRAATGSSSPRRPAISPRCPPKAWTQPGSRRSSPPPGSTRVRGGRIGRQRHCGRHWRCGEARRWPTRPKAPSCAPKQPGWRRPAWRRRRSGSRPTCAGGRHAELQTAELETLTREHPRRERMWGQRILALYRSGRQVEALRTYQDLRRFLAEEFGLEPSPATASLETAILHQSPDLNWRPSTRSPTASTVTAQDLSARRPGFLARTPRRWPPSVKRAELVRRLDQACEGRGSLLLIGGEAGVGKTRLAEETGAEAARTRAPSSLSGAATRSKERRRTCPSSRSSTRCWPPPPVPTPSGPTLAMMHPR